MSAPNVPVLMYHHVTPAGGMIAATPDVFEAQISRLARAGYQTFEEEVEIVAGERMELAARLVPAVRAPTAPPGRLSINTRPWSKVYIGRRLIGTTPIAEARVTSGTVRLRLVDRDGRSHNRAVRVGAGETERVFYDLNR